eukprot:scaffold109345_cov42-Phaeocystis_antarctica.AAC.2
MSAYTQHTLSLAPPLRGNVSKGNNVRCPTAVCCSKSKFKTLAAGPRRPSHRDPSCGTVTPTAARRHMRAFANPTMLPQAEGSSESDLASWRPQLAFYLRAGQKVALRQHATILADRVAVGADLLLL